MPKKKRKAAAPTVTGGLKWSLGLLGIALGLAAYLAWGTLSGGRPLGCGPTGGCDAVLNSQWAYWFGVPVSVLALPLYLVLIAAIRVAGYSPNGRARARAWLILFPGALALLGAALWFEGLQIFVIRRFCPFCLATHLTGAGAAVTLLITAPLGLRKGQPTEVIPPATLGFLTVLSGLGMVALALGQVMSRPAGAVVEGLASGIKTSGATPASREVEVYGGAYNLNLSEVPVMGNPSATNVMVSLHDYTCHHCRIMHGHLKAIVSAHSNHLAIISLPMPLDAECNPAMRKTPPPHLGACEYARLALAVWHKQPVRLAEFEEFLFQPETPPRIEQAREVASRLVGSNDLAAALADPWVDTQLQKNIGIYQTSISRHRNGSMPQILIGTNLWAGTFRNAGELFDVVETQFGLRRPASLAQ